MVTEDTHYNFIASQVKDRGERKDAAFNMFIRLYASIVGGAIWLSMQPQVVHKEAAYNLLSNILVIVLAVMCGLTIVENQRSWYGYRTALSKFGSDDKDSSLYIPRPSVFRASWLEASMLITMAIATALFYFFNPFST